MFPRLWAGPSRWRSSSLAQPLGLPDLPDIGRVVSAFQTVLAGAPSSFLVVFALMSALSEVSLSSPCPPSDVSYLLPCFIFLQGTIII